RAPVARAFRAGLALPPETVRATLGITHTLEGGTMRRLIAAFSVAIIAACSSAPAATGGGGASPAPVAGGTLTYGQNFPIQIADPANQKGSADHAIFFNV